MDLSITIAVFTVALLVALLFESLVSIYGIIKKRNDIADVAWGSVFLVVIIAMFSLTQTTNYVFKILFILIMIWGVRLTLHIGSRHFAKSVEDPRYGAWREQWTRVKTRSFFQVYLLQGVFAVVVLSSFITYYANPGQTPVLFVVLGLLVWITGFVFEVVGDWQLGQFIKDPSRYGLKKGDLMTKGLWSLTRHPNYFGEMTMWWGIWLICLWTFNPAYMIVSAIGPAVITYLLIYVSGVAKTEALWEEKYGDKFEEYKKTTSKILPLKKR